MRRTRTGLPGRTLIGAAVLVLCGATSACTSMSGEASKAGGDPQPITLTMGTDDVAGRPAAEQIEEFARHVEELSGGSMLVEPRLRAVGPEQPAWDQKVARLVVDGELDLGMIPSRAWDTEGVDTLRPLSTPFLITTDEAMNEVVLDDDLAGDLMAGLEEAGVTGLALVPEALRHLFLYGAPELSPDGLNGAVVRAPRSETTWAFFEALGALPTDSFEDGSWTVAESSFAYAPPGVSRTALGDLTPFPKVNVVVANSEVLGSLTVEERSVLDEAALATRDWAVKHNPTVTEAARTWCEDGLGNVAMAGQDVVAAMRAAARPVIEELRRDPQVAALVARIADLAATGSSSTLENCQSSSGSLTASANLEPNGGDIPNGTYRAEYTDAYLRPRVSSEEQVASNHGVWTFRLHDGHWEFDQAAPDITDHAEGVYEVRGDDLYWELSEGQVLHFRWWTDKEGDLHFDQYRDFGWDADPNYPFPDFQFALEWVRVE